MKKSIETKTEEVAENQAASAKKQKRNKRVKLPADLSSVERFSPSAETGLSSAQVAQRTENGFVNVDCSRRGKSVAGIIFSNIFTFFNIIYMVIAILLCANGAINQCAFVLVVVCNTVIAIIQEIKSKITLDKLNLITEPKIPVMRDGTEQEISVNDIVLDDIVRLSHGAQISADCEVVEGTVEVNESILTGESDALMKQKGDILYAGSFVVSGKCVARVVKVGKYNYISNLTGKAKKYSKPRSQMLQTLHRILIFVAIIIVPLTLALFLMNANAAYSSRSDASDIGVFAVLSQLNADETKSSIVLTAGSIVSMIPAGPFLLTSVALAASFLRLSKRKTMVQELYCIEMLARVDTLCLDKTGTITDGTMRVVDCIDLREEAAPFTVKEIMASMNSALGTNNLTGKALKKFFGSPRKPQFDVVRVFPFSSGRKLSAVSFKDQGTYILGAPEFVMKSPGKAVKDLVKQYAEQGLRVLLLAQTSSVVTSNNLPQTRRPVALIVIEDHIRPDASETIRWFAENGVEVKVISGDNAQTVATIAHRVGIPNAAKSYISLEGLSEEEVVAAATKYTVFGRVSPEQKAILVKSLRASDHTVAMTGDGVNDILAMKESDCSISLAGGSDAARRVAHLILMDDNFSALPDVVAEGRRVVNNIQNSTSMYFMKTIYVIVINIMLVALSFSFGTAFQTPLKPLQTMLIDSVVVGIPTTLLALQPNESQIKGNFFSNVVRRCLPASLTFIISTLSFYVLQFVDVTLVPVDQLGTMVTICYTFGGLFALLYACIPLNKWRLAMYIADFVVVLVCLCVPSIYNMFEYEALGREQLLLMLVEILAMPFVMYFFIFIFHRQKFVLKKATEEPSPEENAA